MATKRQFCYCIYTVILVLIGVATLNLFIQKFTEKSDTMSTKFVSVDFEVFGKVQGVFFRKYTKQQASSLNLKGWVKNTFKDTVVGHLEGDPAKVEDMKKWLESTGSPSSKIEKAVFKNEKVLSELEFNSFEIRQTN